MFRVLSEKDLLEAFRPMDRKHVEIPATMKFPFNVRDYITWGDPSGARTFLVFSDPTNKKTLGIAFRRDQSRDGAKTSRMCDWCHAHGTADEIGLLTATATSRRRVGVNLCLDLSCVSKAESRGDLGGIVNTRALAHRVVERMTRFARQSLF